MRDLHLFGQFCDHEIDRLERELAELGNGDDSPSFAEQHAMLFAAREEQVARRREGADQLSRMSRDQDYRPPAKWQTIFQQREMKGQER
jgi:hypothetical protein